MTRPATYLSVGFLDSMSTGPISVQGRHSGRRHLESAMYSRIEISNLAELVHAYSSSDREPVVRRADEARGTVSSAASAVSAGLRRPARAAESGARPPRARPCARARRDPRSRHGGARAPVPAVRRERDRRRPGPARCTPRRRARPGWPRDARGLTGPGPRGEPLDGAVDDQPLAVLVGLALAGGERRDAGGRRGDAVPLAVSGHARLDRFVGEGRAADAGRLRLLAALAHASKRVPEPLTFCQPIYVTPIISITGTRMAWPSRIANAC